LKKALVRLVRQSPAMIVAMLALFVALTGTAVATTSALITGNQIKNSSITGLDVKNKSLTPRDFRGSVRGPRGLRGLPGATGATGATGAKGDKGDKGDAGVPATRLWAVVTNPIGASNSTLIRGAGVVSLSESTYVEVVFNQDVSNCAFMVSRNSPNTGTEAAGFVQAHSGATPNAVQVATRTEAGAITDGNFHLAVFC
jgi:hypothetical protein